MKKKTSINIETDEKDRENTWHFPLSDDFHGIFAFELYIFDRKQRMETCPCKTY